MWIWNRMWNVLFHKLWEQMGYDFRSSLWKGPWPSCTARTWTEDHGIRRDVWGTWHQQSHAQWIPYQFHMNSILFPCNFHVHSIWRRWNGIALSMMGEGWRLINPCHLSRRLIGVAFSQLNARIDPAHAILPPHALSASSHGMRNACVLEPAQARVRARRTSQLTVILRKFVTWELAISLSTIASLFHYFFHDFFPSSSLLSFFPYFLCAILSVLLQNIRCRTDPATCSSLSRLWPGAHVLRFVSFSAWKCAWNEHLKHLFDLVQDFNCKHV